jgi:hypothetical protein
MTVPGATSGCEDPFRQHRELPCAHAGLRRSAKERTTAPRLQITDRRLWPMAALAFDNRMAGYGDGAGT